MTQEPLAPESAEARALDALVEILKSANTPDVWQAQSILLRRLALQGDVVGSRVPAPLNITEVGGYLNLLTDLQQPEMRAQALAGILGVAGPNPPAGWFALQPPLAMVVLANDRPEGAVQAAIPLSLSVRSDFAAALQGALATIHEQGAALPLLAGAAVLPPAGAPVGDTLVHLGRVLQVVPGVALNDATTDPIVLARATGSSDAFVPMARVLAPGPVVVPPANWDALECDATSCTPVAQPATSYVPISAALALAGFYPPTPPPQPVSSSSHEWSRFTNVTGLVVGMTRLGDELSLLHASDQVAASAFASQLHWKWNGAAFAP